MNFIKIFLFFLLPALNSFAQPGCTDHYATNFDPLAVINDGSCIYPVTTLPLTFKCYIDSIELNETSGIVNQENNFWTHVDDTENSIYKIDTLSASIFQKVTINNSSNHDWEDISSDSNYIYIGDVGNNDGNRTNLCFYKVLKSDITPTTTSVDAGKINFTYSDQVNFTIDHNHNFYDCEAFFVLHDTIHIFTKGWVNRWTKHYVLPVDTGTVVAQLVDSFFVNGFITSAAIQGDSLVVLLGLNFYGIYNCFVWMLNDFDGTDFFSGNKRRFELGDPFIIGQTEGICFNDSNKGYITNERIGSVPAQLREFDLNSYLNFSVGVNELSAEKGFHIYPNPFTHSTNIDYTLKQSSKIRLDVFNILGERVARLVDSYMQHGQYNIQFDGNYPGIYFVKFSENDKTVVRKIVKTN